MLFLMFLIPDLNPLEKTGKFLGKVIKWDKCIDDGLPAVNFSPGELYWIRRFGF